MTEREAPRKIKVVDRRHFDERGDLRPDRPQPEPGPPVADNEPSPSPSPAERPPAAQKQDPRPGPTLSEEAAAATRTSPLFMELIAGLAQQAEILLVGGQGLPAQPAEAKHVIDYLGMLEEKTEGNLSTEEKQVLSNVIFQLRTLYVQHGR